MQVYLNITSWAGVSLDAIHLYGSLQWMDGTDFKIINLERELTRKEAKELTKIDGGDFQWKKGMKTERFDTREGLIDLAVASYKTHCPQATVLVLGMRSAAYDPQLVLDGPEEYKNAANKLYEQAKSIDFWHTPDKMQEICDQWSALRKSVLGVSDE